MDACPLKPEVVETLCITAIVLVMLIVGAIVCVVNHQRRMYYDDYVARKRKGA